MAVVGIDLGTTHSVIATPQRFEGKYFELTRGVTVIKDDYNQRLTPSVVAVNRQGDLLVGRRAKARAGMQPEPIMFVKRSMGEAVEFELGDRRLRPEEVSAEILRYLKTMAEKQMGEEIEEAVITVPAYFTTLQKQKTKEAGELAGLSVGEILQEPVAAALMYCYDDDRDPLTIMTYDLGGGTFDVAVLRKEEGVFTSKSHDGDRYLGGYDFDKRLVYWIIDRLNAQGYRIEIDPESPDHRAALSKLLVLAETVKIALSDREVYALMEPNTGIFDARGEPVSIDVEITRETFEGLIEDYIDESVRLCHRAVRKAEIELQAIDEIVMVGGSSRIPLISRRLEAEFGLRPRLVAPDLSVGIGAAIVARRLGRRIGPLKLGHIPESTSSPSIQIAGIVAATEESPDVAWCTVVLVRADGLLPQRQQVGENGGFLFPQVPLAAEAANTFSLRVEKADGSEMLTHRFTVRRETAGAPIQSPTGITFVNVLAKPISIMTTAGLYTVAEERTPLPHECHVPAQTTDQTGEVRIPVYEDTYQIGEIVVESVPTDVPIGSQVDITLTLRTDFYIDGRAYVPAADVEGLTTIQVKPVAIRGLAELQAEYLKLNQKAAEALVQADRGQAFAVASRLNAALAASRRLLYDERDPNLAKAQELLAEVETLTRHLESWQPDPPPEQFERTRLEIKDELLPDLYTVKPAADDGSYEGQVKAIAQMGERALRDKDETAWADANRRLDDLRERIISTIDQEERRRRRRAAGGEGREEPPDPRAIKLKLGLDLTQLREEARRRGRLAELEADFESCEQTLKGIDPKASSAMAQLVEYYQNQHQPLYAKVVGRVTRPDKEPGWVAVLKQGR
jgi:actin-like ATPase involved in cell morphogenesis